MKNFKTFIHTFFLFIFLFYRVDAKCEKITNSLRTDNNWNFDDTFYSFSGGNITFVLTDMPCGASVLLIQVISQNGGGNYYARTFTNSDLNVVRYIGVNVIAEKYRQFRIQAKVDDFENINCPNPSFSGELCYSLYVDTPDCAKEKSIAIGVPIATAIIGAIGGILGVLIKQYFDHALTNSEYVRLP
ncbi:hypothetical protein GLOIN_2v1868591 [Rhizophagus irregularis DAOM 181602=DAOM 197198]|uniref:Uncharacterized protein n=2 Tax=Rhizophagus irregularis TaxID=588596 RepID=U9ULT4_RHIID|nr:hypothetical protein GLOIN_2v1868591 [Rhizophagus irregularis DAOM 181602=DAOM 197198]POG80915.1 hypothetical protein GLOIN_2v1868591 [Rhizophagus irregularis DAOM 181602=DAOM 197198]GBC21695.2 hypothetical protein GLOIN_2v1868591 [Rhizophagus irregularis DAOM 181602=DAOM 197198]|eukprot:XP_025187781.1 hypothetical protein GLOIN_2v1868591 [Rhizophagus irregularis DAOM 181602=DAOM 197198]